MEKINKEWHLAHLMPKNPTLDQRVEWHIAHARVCTCRSKLPGSVEKEIKKRGIKI
jgi:hypothetical protein